MSENMVLQQDKSFSIVVQPSKNTSEGLFEMKRTMKYKVINGKD